jgi:hypothetical protein
MFRRLSEPLPLSEASLLMLRPALNAPVLNAGFLPVGPARAAIVVFAEEWGGFGIALGIRSNESGGVAVFRNQESIESERSVATALEPLLAEAERLGFVFDEDMLARERDGQARAQALGLWGRLMGELEMPPTTRFVAPEPAVGGSGQALPPRTPLMDPEQEAAAGEELILEEVASASPALPEVTLDTPIRTQASDPPASRKAREAAHREVPQAKLSRFREPDPGVDASVGSAGAGSPEASGGGRAANALGRIPIVRVRRERDSSRRLPLLARLLASF